MALWETEVIRTAQRMISAWARLIAPLSEPERSIARAPFTGSQLTAGSSGSESERDQCRICRSLLQPYENCPPGLEPWMDCGGDCLLCMANAGDPECIRAMSEWVKRLEQT